MFLRATKIFHPRQSRSPRINLNNRLLLIDSNRNLDSIDEQETLVPGEMADVLVDQIFKALRLVPEFDGNSNILTRFINLCDQLVNQYMQTEAGYELSNLSLINGILNKITGPAARTINSNGIPETWEAIRRTLINNFADHRDETSLYNDLSLLTQGSRTPHEFYEQCQNLFSTIMTYISLHETIASTIEAKRALYKKLTLQSYLRGLRDPLGARIRCMRPDTIEKALEYVHDEMNTLYLQQRNEHLPDRKLQSTSSFNNPKFSYSSPPAIALPPPRVISQMPIKPFNGPAMPGPSRPFVIQPQRPMPTWKPQAPLHGGPSRTQQMFAAPPPNYRPQSNVFRLPQRNAGFQSSINSNAAPQPMSGVSHYVAKSFPSRTPHDWTKFGNPPPSNYFKTREINFNEFYDPQYQYDPYYDYDGIDYQQDYYEYPDFAYGASYNPPSYHPEYIPNVSVEEPQEEAHLADSEDFQKPSKSEKPK